MSFGLTTWRYIESDGVSGKESWRAETQANGARLLRVAGYRLIKVYDALMIGIGELPGMVY